MNLFRSPQHVTLIGRPTFSKDWMDAGEVARTVSVAIDIYNYAVVGSRHPTETDKTFSRGFQEIDNNVLWDGLGTSTAARLAAYRHNDGEPVSSGRRGVSIVHRQPGRVLDRQIPLSMGLIQDFERHLLLLRFKDSVQIDQAGEPNLEKKDAMTSLSCLTDRIESTFATGDWKALAILLESGLRCDVALGCTTMNEQTNRPFNVARLYGAWGGTFDGRCMVLLTPPEKRMKVLCSVADVTDEIKVKVDLLGTIPLYAGR